MSDTPPWCALEPAPGSVRRARQHARAFLAHNDPIIDSVELVVSELVTNAVIHAPEGYTAPPGVSPIILLSVQAEARWVLVAVCDPWPGIPLAPVASEQDESGRGLQLVDELAACWWTEVREHAKTVHALMLRPGAALADDELPRLHRSSAQRG